ncbi:MAG: DUF123 domain-containing protein [Sulfolobaceae archaeon]|nr:DUF123 domain-containing protein [Sulfolobaceae archaeon]
MRPGYLILINCENEHEIKTRSGRIFYIDKGLYVYVGSGGNNPLVRVFRHLYNYSKYKNFWHIDYLAEVCKPIDAIILSKDEKELARILSTYFTGVKSFGSTDDKLNETHLFKIESLLEFFLIVRILSGG